jgi:hypothetical protein
MGFMAKDSLAQTVNISDNKETPSKQNSKLA